MPGENKINYKLAERGDGNTTYDNATESTAWKLTKLSNEATTKPMGVVVEDNFALNPAFVDGSTFVLDYNWQDYWTNFTFSNDDSYEPFEQRQFEEGVNAVATAVADGASAADQAVAEGAQAAGQALCLSVRHDNAVFVGIALQPGALARREPPRILAFATIDEDFGPVLVVSRRQCPRAPVQARHTEAELVALGAMLLGIVLQVLP